MLKIPSSIVDVHWLHQNLRNDNLIILNATIKKAGLEESATGKNMKIPNAIFFDIKSKFSDSQSLLPNTFPDEEQFQENSRALGIKQDSCIVVYDELGVYSSPRAWWLFKSFGFDNITVLNGGLPEWKKHGYILEENIQRELLMKGDFIASLKSNNIKYTGDILDIIKNNDSSLLDARSAGRFNATQPEPRADLKGGHVPTSISLPYSDLQENGKMKNKS